MTGARRPWPHVATIEVLEWVDTTAELGAEPAVIVPNDLRLDGRSLLLPEDAVVTVTASPRNAATVEITLFCARVVVEKRLRPDALEPGLNVTPARPRCCQDHHYTCCASFDDDPPTPCCPACPCAPRTPTTEETNR